MQIDCIIRPYRRLKYVFVVFSFLFAVCASPSRLRMFLMVMDVIRDEPKNPSNTEPPTQ